MDILIQKISRLYSSNKDFAFFTTISVLGGISASLSPLLIAKMLNPDGFGSYSLAMSIIFLGLGLLVASSQTPAIIFSNREIESSGKINKTFSILLGINIVIILFVTLALLLLKDQVVGFIGYAPEYLITSVIVALVGYSLKAFSQTILLSLDKLKESALQELIFGLSSFVIILSIFLFFKVFSLPVIISSFLAAGLINLIFTLNHIDTKIILPLVIDKEILNEVLKFTRWQVGGLTIGYALGLGNNVILRMFLTTSEIGILNLASKIFAGLLSIIYSVNKYFLPFLSRNKDNKKALEEYLAKTRLRIFLLISLCAIASIFFVPLFIKNIYGDIYQDSIILFHILSINLFVTGYYVFYLPLFNALGEYKIIQIITTLVLLTGMILNYLYIPTYGLHIAVISSTAANIFSLIAFEIYHRRKILPVYIEE